MPDDGALGPTELPQFIAPRGAARAYQPVGRAERVAVAPAGVRVHAGRTIVEVTVLAPGITRVGLFADGRPPEYSSEAVVAREWPAPEVRVEQTSAAVVLRSVSGAARVALDPVRVSFEDEDGRPFAEDDPELGMGHLAPPAGAGWPEPLGAPGRVHKVRPPDERYFGCGERTGGLEKTGTRPIFWNHDPPREHSPSLGHLYMSIPFVLALRGGRAWGLFVDHPGRVEIDLAKARADRLSVETDGGDLVCYVFSGPSPREVLERYTALTGRTPMPPLWALGNHQSRWGYASADEIRALARSFREHDLPCDALYLDIDYMDGFRVFTWDRTRYADPAELARDVAAEGIRLVAIANPGIRVDETYATYVSGRERDVYCKTPGGAEYRNVVWPGVCAFPDFTNPAVRAWWGEWLPAIVGEGVSGVWCDMNEPALFVPGHSTMPGDVVHPGGGRARLHAQLHNAYGSLMAQATREALLARDPERRPFVISRSGYAGLQRHALHWTGDNSSWWEHAEMSVPQLQNLGLSGLAWVGVDVGGFFEDSNGELLTRWTEAALFFPFYRNHCNKTARRQEPWVFGEPWLTHLRALLKLRQRLLPLLYALFEECHRTGAPIVRPLLFEEPGDVTGYNVDTEFLVGRALLVAPIARPGIEHRAVYLPRGTWLRWRTGEATRGPSHLLARAPIGQPTAWARANVAVPLWPEMAHVGARPPDPLTLVLHVAEGADQAALYEDEGDGTGFTRGVYARRQVRCERTSTGLRVVLGAREGTYVPERARVELEIYGLTARPERVHVDGAAADPSAVDWDGRALRVALRERVAETVVEAAFDA